MTLQISLKNEGDDHSDRLEDILVDDPIPRTTGQLIARLTQVADNDPAWINSKC